MRRSIFALLVAVGCVSFPQASFGIVPLDNDYPLKQQVIKIPFDIVGVGEGDDLNEAANNALNDSREKLLALMITAAEFHGVSLYDVVVNLEGFALSPVPFVTEDGVGMGGVLSGEIIIYKPWPPEAPPWL